MQLAPNDTAAGEPGARRGACRSKGASSGARHGKRRDGSAGLGEASVGSGAARPRVMRQAGIHSRRSPSRSAVR